MFEKCFKGCQFCVFKRAVPGRKTHRNKSCKSCFYCRSTPFCPSCSKCPSCCTKSNCRGQIEPVLEDLGVPRGLKQSSTDLETNALRQGLLMEALHALIQKNAVEKVNQKNSLAFFNRLFLVPKTNNKWRPILDLSALNKFLKVGSFKMETPESIRTSLQQGEWVTSIDFRDAYFHIPISPQSRNYIRFHIQGQSYQLKVLPFGLSTAWSLPL